MRLLVLNERSVMGELVAGTDGRVSFNYDEDWRSDPATFPLSLSMPKIAKKHGGGVVSNWLWNLLPENELALQRIANDTSHGWQRVSAKNPLALLAKIGEDCAGAIQLVRPERLGDLPEGEITFLSDPEIEARLKDLRENRGATGREAHDKGQFSLAGAQTKTAFHFSADGRWGLPSGIIPTTHIFKPPIPGLKGQVENEHFCLRLASALGVASVHSKVMTFGAEQAIVVERYDRQRLDGRVRRVHQEDMCQALRFPPSKKYQSEKGPGFYDIITRVLASSANSEMDRALFVQAASLNYVLVGTDAHAKNFSVLFGRGGVYRLAPIYDVNSYLPYAQNVDDCLLSMSVEGHSMVGEIKPRNWQAQARRCGLPADVWVDSLRDLVARAPDLASDVLRQCRDQGLSTEILDRLADGIAARCKKLADIYGVEAVISSGNPGEP